MIQAICGPMFSGKSQELIRRARRVQYTVPSPTIRTFKPKLDTRTKNITTHNGQVIVCEDLEDINGLDYDEGDWVFVDEFQFADEMYIRILRSLSKAGVNVVVAGLNLDSRGEPFGAMAKILPYCDGITVLTSLCQKCGSDATKTQRKEAKGDSVMVGDSHEYEARCNQHWEPR